MTSNHFVKWRWLLGNQEPLSLNFKPLMDCMESTREFRKVYLCKMCGTTYERIGMYCMHKATPDSNPCGANTELVDNFPWQCVIQTSFSPEINRRYSRIRMQSLEVEQMLKDNNKANAYAAVSDMRKVGMDV